MTTNYFTSLSFLKTNSLVHSNVNDNQLTVVLRRVQKIRIEPILGTPLYKDLLEKIGSGSIAGDDKTLLDDYLVPTILIYVEHACAEYNNVEIRNKNVGRSNDEHQSANTDTETATFMASLYKDAKVYESTMIGYLQDNRDKFPLYCKWQTELKENVNPKKDEDSLDNTISFVIVNE
jgi:hypothetical protein